MVSTTRKLEPPSDDKQWNIVVVTMRRIFK